MIVEKEISQLAVGSYVIDIVKQNGNYHIKQPGWVRDYHAIEFLIHQGVSRVLVDTSKQLPTLEEVAEPDEVQKQEPTSKPKPKKTFKKDKFADQFFHAQELFSEAKQVQAKVLDDIRQGRPINAESVVALTDQSIETVFDNPDALACVINIRNKDEYLLEHSISVSILMAIFGRFLRFEKSLVKELAIGAFLHDVGKIKIPDRVLNKPAKLTPEEFELMKNHVIYSSEIVNSTQGISPLSRQVVAHHHEKLNGQGYPKGLNAEQLDTYSRMITICDIFDALTANRVYKDGIAQIRSFAILRELAQSGELDLQLVDSFIKCLGVYPVGSLVRLNSNKLAMVEKVNQDNPIKPLVRAFFSLKQNVFVEAKDIDLALDESHQIEQGVRADEFDLDMNKITEFLMIQG